MTVKTNPNYTDISPKSEHLKNIWETVLNNDLVRFVETACSSLQSRRGLKRRDCYKRSLLYYAAMGNCTNLLLQ